jgi:hypothetical protein
MNNKLVLTPKTKDRVKKIKKVDILNNVNNQEAENEIENTCLTFEKYKPYLVENWDRRD